MERPKPSKITIKCRKLRRIDMKILRSDIIDSSLYATNKTCDVNAVITQYNSGLFLPIAQTESLLRWSLFTFFYNSIMRNLNKHQSAHQL